MKYTHLQMPDGVVTERSDRTTGRFIFQPLERGYGVSIGNSLRRVLISSLPGVAIVAIRVNDAPHEFTTLEGVIEDLSEIILNLKEVRFKDLTKRASKIELTLKGPKTFTAQDIQDSTSDYEVLNPEKHIATLNKDAELEIELRMGTGIGYVTSDENKKADIPLNYIAVDSIYSPIRNVNYVIENTRVGQRTDYEKLILDVVTDGSITPDEALTSAAKILRDHIQLFIDLNPEQAEEPVKQEKEEERDEEFENVRKILLTPVDELDLSVRSQNCLRSANIKNIADLVSKDENEMLHYRNFGRKSLAELGELVQNYGLQFGMDIEKYLTKEEIQR